MKKLMAWILTAAMLFSISIPVTAHDAKEHDRLLELILFGEENSPRLSTKEAKQTLEALEAASYLALDQFNGKGEDKLQFLRETFKVKNLPKTIKKIDFKGNSTHRTYTHRGWEYDYPIDKAHWSIRRKILLETTEKVFDFQWLPNEIFGIERSYDEKCESFAALVYYIHVLGDQEARTSYRAKELMMPLARPHPSADNRDIFYELEHHLSVLFEGQQKTRKYKSLMQGLRELAVDARSLASLTGGINSDERFAEFKEQVASLFELLELYVPKLLAKEEFFTDVFPKEDKKAS